MNNYPLYELCIDDDLPDNDMYIILVKDAICPADFFIQQYPIEKPCPKWLEEMTKPFSNKEEDIQE